MSKQEKENFAQSVIRRSNNKKQRKESRILLKNIVDEFNQEPNMRGLGDTGHLAGEW